MEDKIDLLSTSLKAMQEMMAEKGFLGQEGTAKNYDPGENAKVNKDSKSQVSSLQTTIYKNAVKRVQTGNPEITFLVKEKRDSTSSEDRIDTSDELMEIDDVHNQFIADCQRRAKDDEMQRREEERRHDKEPRRQRDRPGECNKQLDESQQVIREAEASKARLFGTKGIYNNSDLIDNWQTSESELRIRSADIDENYLVIGAHIDLGTQQKVVNNEYVDFAKLIPKSRFGRDDDNRLELITDGEKLFISNQGHTSGKWFKYERRQFPFDIVNTGMQTEQQQDTY